MSSPRHPAAPRPAAPHPTGASHPTRARSAGASPAAGVPRPAGASRAPAARPVRETRSLPVVAARAVEVPFAIQPYDEVVAHDTTWCEHSHPFHELLWNERGASSAVVGARVWTITPALGLWTPAGTLHSGSAIAGTWFRASCCGCCLSGCASRACPPHRGRSLRRWCSTCSNPRRVNCSSRRPPRPCCARSPTRCARTPGDQRTLSQWAAELAVSARTISRAFAAETGTSFARWVASIRAQHAVALLARGWEVEAVAAEVGYRSASAFGAAFRRTTGLTPGAFQVC